MRSAMESLVKSNARLMPSVSSEAPFLCNYLVPRSPDLRHRRAPWTRPGHRQSPTPPPDPRTNAARTLSATDSRRLGRAGKGASEGREAFQERRDSGQAEEHRPHAQDRQRASKQRDGGLMPHDLTI